MDSLTLLVASRRSLTGIWHLHFAAAMGIAKNVLVGMTAFSRRSLVSICSGRYTNTQRRWYTRSQRKEERMSVKTITLVRVGCTQCTEHECTHLHYTHEATPPY